MGTDRRHLRKPVEFKMLLRPILLHMPRYSEYISDRDMEPSGFVSKCAFSLDRGQGLGYQANIETMTEKKIMTIMTLQNANIKCN